MHCTCVLSPACTLVASLQVQAAIAGIPLAVASNSDRHATVSSTAGDLRSRDAMSSDGSRNSSDCQQQDERTQSSSAPRPAGCVVGVPWHSGTWQRAVSATLPAHQWREMWDEALSALQVPVLTHPAGSSALAMENEVR